MVPVAPRRALHLHGPAAVTTHDVELVDVAMRMTGPLNEERFWFLVELYLKACSHERERAGAVS